MTDPTQAEVPAGMKAYGPAHPDYPNAPKDWNGGPVLLRNGATSHNAQRWSVGYPADLCNHPTGTDIIAYTPSTSVQGAGEAGELSAEWCLNMARLEEGAEIGAGSPDHPLRVKCERPPLGWVCTREPGHDGPCAATALSPPAPASVADEARERKRAMAIIAKSWADRGFPDSAEQIAEQDVWVVDAMLAFAARPAGEGERPSDDDLDPHLPEHVGSEKRCGIQRSAWLDGWYVPWSPRNDNESAEGPWSHWVALANEIIAVDQRARAALATEGTPS